jgi:protein tyrosine phosphatase (PTP) superfamily phosphohydrolase (DUF442 family)
MKVSDRIYSGSEPYGEEGFASLAKLGVKAVISVDGAKPNLEAAKKHGLRYVHVPFGYDGVPEEARLSLTSAVREIDSPIYVHCHHGEHRGPAGAAIACIAADALSNKEAIQILERAGTSKNYKGLWRDVEAFVPPAVDAKLPELVEVATVDSLTAAMSQVDRAFDNLKLCRDAKWAVPDDHPDIVPNQEALLLFEGLHEASRNLGDHNEDQLKNWLAEAETQAAELRSDVQKKDSQAATERLVAIEHLCKQCHQKYRDN